MRAVFKAAVHHSRSSIIVPAGAASSASPASTSPPLSEPTGWRQGCGPMSESGRAEARSLFRGAAGRCVRPCGAVAHEASRLAMPLRIDPVDGVLEYRRGSVVVFRGDEDEAVGLRDRGGPFLNDLVLERRATRRGRRYWLIEERHRKVAQIEQPRVDAIALFQVLQNPASRAFPRNGPRGCFQQ